MHYQYGRFLFHGEREENMIRMYVLPGGDVCHEVGVSHVNQHLIEMMEDVMEDYDPDWEKHGGAEHLRIDKGFAAEIAYLFPPECSQEKGGFFFFLLYDLLKARDCYKPNLTMEYIFIENSAGRRLESEIG